MCGCAARYEGASRGAWIRKSARRGREGMSTKRENTPMSDNLLKKHIHCTLEFSKQVQRLVMVDFPRALPTQTLTWP